MKTPSEMNRVWAISFRPLPETKSATRHVFPRIGFSGLNRPCVRSCAQIGLSRWRTNLLIVSSCCLLLALSGCAGVSVNGALSLNATSVAFGNVLLNAPATQSVTVTSTGNAPITIDAATLTGTGFKVSGAAFPVTLDPNQSVTLNVQFDPIAAGAATGQLTITSVPATVGSMVISLSGTGVTPHYAVELNWDAPVGSPVPIAGYYIFRESGGSATYQMLNLSLVTQTTYTDSTVESGQKYNYYVVSVDTSGIDSAPSNTAAVTVN